MAVTVRVIYRVCLADNVSVPQAIPQGIGAVFAYYILSDNAAKVLTCCVIPLSIVGNTTAQVNAGNVKPRELGHSAQGRLCGQLSASC